MACTTTPSRSSSLCARCVSFSSRVSVPPAHATRVRAPASRSAPTRGEARRGPSPPQGAGAVSSRRTPCASRAIRTRRASKENSPTRPPSPPPRSPPRRRPS
ncbi:hypothetical protein C8T65DRAFT_676566, partial [Cerioporus squamosus]